MSPRQRDTGPARRAPRRHLCLGCHRRGHRTPAGFKGAPRSHHRGSLSPAPGTRATGPAGDEAAQRPLQGPLCLLGPTEDKGGFPGTTGPAGSQRAPHLHGDIHPLLSRHRGPPSPGGAACGRPPGTFLGTPGLGGDAARVRGRRGTTPGATLGLSSGRTSHARVTRVIGTDIAPTRKRRQSLCHTDRRPGECPPGTAAPGPSAGGSPGRPRQLLWRVSRGCSHSPSCASATERGGARGAGGGRQPCPACSRAVSVPEGSRSRVCIWTWFQSSSPQTNRSSFYALPRRYFHR